MTGGTGFLGGWCIASLLERGYDVRTTVRDLAREKAVRDFRIPCGRIPRAFRGKCELEFYAEPSHEPRSSYASNS